MSHERIDHALRELVEVVVNGEALPEQRALLEHRLLESEAARDFYLEYVNLHSALRRRFLTPEEDAVDMPAELADFRLAVAGESFQVRRPRWRTATLLAMATGLVLVLVAILIWQRQTSSAVAREIATIQAIEGEATLVSAETSRTAQIGDTVRSGDTLRLGADAARATLKYPDGTVVRLHSGSVVQSPANRDVRLRLFSGSIEVDAAKQPPNRPLVFATEHSRYVVLGTRFRLYHEQETSRLELDEGKVRMERPVSGEAVEIQAGSVAIAADENTPVEILPLSAGQAELHKSLRDAGQKVAFSTDGDQLFTSHWEQGLKCWRVEDVELEHKYARDPGSSDALATTPEEQTVVQVNRNGYVLAWSPGKAESIKLPLTGVQARSRAVSPEGQVVAESSVDGTIVYGLDLASGKLSERFKHTGSGKAWCLALSSGGERLAAGFWDGTTRVYDVASSQVVFERKLLHTPTHVDLTADGQMLLVFTQRDGLRVIDLSTGEQRALWPPGSEMVRCVRFTSDGTRVIAGLNDRTARMWRVKDGRQLLLIEAGQSPQGIAWSEKQQLLATADGSVKLWKCRFDVAGSSDRPINDQ